MSFILDALRKSEDERRRDAVPGISRAPMAVPRDRLPRWALGVMAALAVCVLALGAAWWASQRTGGIPGSATPAAATATPPPAVERLPADVAAPEAGPAAVAPGGSPVDAAAVPAEAAAANPRTSATTRQAAASTEPVRSLSELAAPAQAAAPSAPEARPEGPLPSLGEIRAQGIAVPALDLQLHSYATAADARFVFINGARYMEGDEVEDDLRVVAIRRDGAVLSRLGREFLLLPE